jgi:hypothetical protein
LFVRSSVW